jgi:hypothetical protein
MADEWEISLGVYLVTSLPGLLKDLPALYAGSTPAYNM